MYTLLFHQARCTLFEWGEGMSESHSDRELSRPCGHAQVSAEALERAGGATQSMGTYVGCMFVDYLALQREAYGMSSTGAAMTCPSPQSLPIACINLL